MRIFYIVYVNAFIRFVPYSKGNGCVNQQTLRIFFLRAMASKSTWTTVSPALSISSYEIRPGDKVPYIIIIYVFTLRYFWAPFIILLFISLSVFYEEFKASAVSKNEGVFVCLLACLPACFVWLCFHIVASGCLA